MRSNRRHSPSHRGAYSRIFGLRLSIKYAEHYHRLNSSSRVIDNEITFDIKDATQVYEVYHTRFTLHKSIYNHKTGVCCPLYTLVNEAVIFEEFIIAKGIEYMIVDALLAAEPHLKIAEQIFDPKKFLYLTDDIVQRIESSEDIVCPIS